MRAAPARLLLRGTASSGTVGSRVRCRRDVQTVAAPWTGLKLLGRFPRKDKRRGRLRKRRQARHACLRHKVEGWTREEEDRNRRMRRSRGGRDPRREEGLMEEEKAKTDGLERRERCALVCAAEAASASEAAVRLAFGRLRRRSLRCRRCEASGGHSDAGAGRGHGFRVGEGTWWHAHRPPSQLRVWRGRSHTTHRPAADSKGGFVRKAKMGDVWKLLSDGERHSTVPAAGSRGA